MYIKNKNKFHLFILLVLSVLYSEDYKSKNMNANQIYILSTNLNESIFKNERIIARIPLQRQPAVKTKYEVSATIHVNFNFTTIQSLEGFRSYSINRRDKQIAYK